MPHVEILFGSLQKADINPLTAEKYISSFENNVQKIREEIDEESTETEPDPPTKKRKCQDSELKREAKEVCDTIICQFKARFGFVGHAVSASPVSYTHLLCVL